MALRFIVPAIAAATVALAQCSTSGTYTITNTADAGRLAACKTYSGSIAIATEATSVDISGPRRITGDVVAIPNGNLTSLSGNDLQIIDGRLAIVEQQAINTISFPALGQVDNFMLQSLGQNLLQLDFGGFGLIQVTNLSIGDTFLTSLTGINLFTAGTISVTNNQLLANLTMQLRNTTGDVTIRGNANGLNVNLNNLQTCGNLFINDCSAVQLDSLESSNGLVAIQQNDITELQLPNLTETTGFTVAGNVQLSNFSAPLLQSTGSLNIQGNDGLNETISLPSLETVSGAVVVNGTFAELDFPKLNRVQGTTNILSTVNINETCSTLIGLGSRVFASRPNCSPTTDEEPSSSASPTGSTSPSSSSDSGSGSGGGNGGNAAPSSLVLSQQAVYTSFGALVAVLVWML